MRILIVEDDQRLTRLMAQVLGEEHFLVDVAHEGDTGLEMALRGMYDFAIVDWMLPGLDGPSLCRAARTARVPTALLMLTARGQIEERVAGLDSGADDYLVKPFAFDELLARLRALGRRFNVPGGGGAELRCGELMLDQRGPDAPPGPGVHPPADSGLRLVVRARRAAVHGRRLRLLFAAQAQRRRPAGPDPDGARRGLPLDGRQCLEACVGA